MKPRNQLLYLIPWLTDFAIFLVVFAVSRDLAETGADLLSMGLIGAVFSLTLGGSCLTFGRLSDRFGRQRVILCGAALLMIGPALAAARWYYVTYTILGISGGMIYPALVAWMSQGRQSGPGRGGMGRALILFCVSWNLGLLCGQVFGGWLFALAPLWLLGVAFALATTNLGIATLARCQPGPPQAESVPPTNEMCSSQALAAAFARLAWVANLGGAFAMSMVIHLLPKLAVKLDVDANHHGFVLGSMRLLVIGVYLIMYWSKFWHFRLATALISQAIAVVGLLMLLAAQSTVGLWIGLAALSQLMGYNYFASLYYSTTGSTDEQRGAASAMHEGTISLGFAAGSALGGLAGHYAGIRAPYMLAAAVIVFLACVQLGMYTHRSLPQSVQASY